ncbi:O-antigen polymerase [Candidatus Moduliflexus flocculans]|uniref:O-antigen polymerase n=1 Tax=Candidatus Moduliflexus flocculans TaxID=1499966 RepID=A0A081BM09_9BACT|nr:O-antigen polymerase [Candidatus Moduliflexus flocculans]
MRRLFVILIFWSPILFTFYDPYFGVVSYVLMNVIRPEQLMWGDRSAAGRIYLFTQAACFFSWLFNRNKEHLHGQDNPIPTQIFLLILFVSDMFIVTFFSEYAESAAWSSIFWKTTLFCFMMSKSVSSPKKMELLYVFVLIWMILLALWGFQQKFSGNTRMEGLGGEMLSDINDLSSVYVMYVPMAYYSLFSRKKWIRLGVAIPSFLIFVIFILFGGSRGAFLGLIVCMGLIFLRAQGVQKLKMVATMVFIGGLLGFVLAHIAPEGFFDEYTARLKTIKGQEDTTTGQVERESSSQGRIAMWQGAWTVFTKNPQYWWTGVGLRCYPSMYYKYFDEISAVLSEEDLSYIYNNGLGGKAIHNAQINILMSGGIPLAILWASLFFFSWQQAHSFPKKYPKIAQGVNLHNYANALEIGIIGWLVCMSFLNIEFVDFFYWHVTMIGVLNNMGKAQLQREHSGVEEDEEEEKASIRIATRRPAFSRF